MSTKLGNVSRNLGNYVKNCLLNLGKDKGVCQLFHFVTENHKSDIASRQKVSQSLRVSRKNEAMRLGRD
jgi:hypothetical protein